MRVPISTRDISDGHGGARYVRFAAIPIQLHRVHLKGVTH
jgi:hypothetical protein